MEIVDKNISDEEICLRCIISPMMWNEKKNIIKDSAFLPPRADNRVSLMRLRYCTKEYVDDYALKFLCRNGRVNYVGTAELLNKVIQDTNEWAQSDKSQLDGVDGVNGIEAKLIATPMHNSEYVLDTHVVYVNDPNVDLYMHADLEYNETRPDDLATKLRHYSKELLKRVRLNIR